MPRQQQEQDPTTQLQEIAAWNGSRVLVDPEAWQEFGRQGSFCGTELLNDTNFSDTPISRLTITEQQRYCGLEIATIYNAEIDLEPLDEGDWTDFLDYLKPSSSSFALINDKMWLQAHPQVEGVYYLASVGDQWLTITFNPNLPHVQIQTLPQKGVVRPESDNTDTAQKNVQYFFSSVMRTLDYVAGLPQANPEDYALNKTYILGSPEPHEDQTAQSAAATGRVAIQGAPPAEPPAAVTAEASPIHHESEWYHTEKRPLFKDLGGLKEIKEDLRELVILRKYPEIQQKWGAEAPGGLLLYGPTGNGKTTIGEAIANELDAKLICVKGRAIIDMWIGSSEKNLERQFDQAQKTKGSVVLFFDEADAILGGGSGEHKAVAGAFKRRAIELKDYPHVLLVLATNHVDRLDPALIASSRIGKHIYIGDPDEATRVDILATQVDMEDDLDNALNHDFGRSEHGHTFRVFSGDLNLLEAAKATEGFNSAALVKIIKNLRARKAMQEAMQRERGVNPQAVQVSPVTHRDLMDEITAMRRRGQTH